MSFAGHVFDMIRRSEANRALVKASRDKAAGLRHIRMRAHDERRRLAIVGGILCAAGLAALIGLTWLFL